MVIFAAHLFNLYPIENTNIKFSLEFCKNSNLVLLLKKKDKRVLNPKMFDIRSLFPTNQLYINYLKIEICLSFKNNSKYN